MKARRNLDLPDKKPQLGQSVSYPSGIKHSETITLSTKQDSIIIHSLLQGQVRTEQQKIAHKYSKLYSLNN